VNESAEIEVLPDPRGGPASAYGPVTSVQAAQLDLPPGWLEQVWKPSSLERLARAYWAYLERISLGLLRVHYTRSSRSIVLVHRRLVLLRFRRPSYEIARGIGQVTWLIERGVLVARGGRGRGYLRITVRRLDDQQDGEAGSRVQVIAQVANFYPGLRLAGPIARLGAFIYNQTQLRIHLLVTRGFLRSLARLELPRSKVGALAEPDPRQAEEASRA
jgi:hypothetical protein